MGLPEEIVLKVLQKLGQWDLLRHCCLVSHVWHELSLRALEQLDMEITGRTKARAKGFTAWLEQRGRHVKALHIRALQSTVLDLTLPAQPQLQQLTIQRARLPTSNRISMLKSLTSLELLHVHATPPLLASLVALRNLRRLSLQNVDFGPLITPASRGSFAERCNKMLAALMQLTELTLQHCDLDNSAVQQISVLQQLQHLDLSGNQLQAPAQDLALPGPAAAMAAAAFSNSILPSLPSSLTTLSLSTNHMHLEVTPLLTRNALPNLKHLSITLLTLCQAPSCLATFTGLTRLDAAYMTLSDDGYELVAAIQQLQQLRHLELQGSFTDAARPDTAALELCLTQLSLLTHLNLADNRLLPLPAPGGAPLPPPVPPLLTSSSHLHLRVLMMGCTELPRGHGPNFRYEGLVLQQLFGCCPNLAALDLSGRIHHECIDSDLLPLTCLTGLTSLALGGKGWLLDDAVFKVLARLTNLHSLEVHEGCDITDRALLELTRLTSLTLLLLADCCGDGVSEALIPLPKYQDAPRELCLQQKGSGHGAKKVWQQLLTRCNNSPACLRHRQQQLEKELQAARKETAQQRKRTAAAEKQAAAAQQEVQELRLLLQSLTAAPTAAEQEVSDG